MKFTGESMHVKTGMNTVTGDVLISITTKGTASSRWRFRRTRSDSSIRLELSPDKAEQFAALITHAVNAARKIAQEQT